MLMVKEVFGVEVMLEVGKVLKLQVEEVIKIIII